MLPADDDAMDDLALFFDPDSTDDLCISYEAFEQILNEEPVPPQSDPSGILDGLHQCEALVQVNFEKALQNQPGMLESSTLMPEHIDQTSTRWDSLDYMDPTYFKKESSSGFHFGSEGCFNNLSDICHPLSIYGGNLPAVRYADSNSFPSLPLNHSSEWLRLSSSKENTCIRGSVGGSFDGLNIGTFDYQQLQNNIVKCCDSSGDTKERDFFNSPCASHINGLYLDCVGGNGSLQTGGENSFQMGVKHSALDVTNNSSPFLLQNGGKVQKGRLCGALSLSSSLDPDATLPDAILAVKKTSEATDSMCNAADSCLTLPRDFATEVDKGSRQILPTPFFQSFLLKKEAILNGKDNHGLQQLLQNSCMTSEAKLGTQEDSLGNSIPNVSQIDSDASLMNKLADEQKHYGDMSSKSESSTDSSPIPSSRNSTSNNTDSSIGNPGKFMVSDSALKFPSKKQKTVPGDKIDQVSALFRNQHSLSRGSYDSVQRNQWRSSLRADADADICVLDDISDPACLLAPVVRPKLQPMLQRSEFSDLYYRGSGDMRLKSDDERLTFQIALQDLSPPKSEANPPDGVLAVPLLRHQRIALSWMVQKETNSLQCSGGILADDQGLGKTISTIALILTERSPSFRSIPTDEKPDEHKPLNLDDDDDVSSEVKVMEQPLSFSSVMMSGPIKRENYAMVIKGRPAAGTLVVCPTSVLRQWAEELKCKVTGEANLTFLIYHGSKRTRDPEEIAKYDVVLTTYAIVSMEVPKQPLVDKDDEKKVISGLVNSKKRKISPNLTTKNQKNALAESSARPLAKVGWFRVILDEAQCIKNHKAQVARACWGLRAKRRWCLSGTPIQNTVDDLYSYFRFLRYDPYAVYKSFCSTIKIPISRNPTNGYKKLQAVLKTIMLRRTKGTLLDGKPIINLPPKTIIMKKVEFSREERSYYSTLEAESREQFQEYAAAGTVKQNYGNILLMLLRLRQTCDHPLLVKKGCDANSIGKSSYEMAKKFPREKQISLLSCFEASVAICTICKDAPEDAVVTICGHVFCNQCIQEHLAGDDCICPSVHCKATLSAASVFSRVTLERCLSGLPDYDNHSRSPSDMGGPPTSENSVFSSSSKINAALEILGSLPRSHPPSKFITEKLNDGCIGSPENAVCGVISKCSMDISERKYSASDKSSNAQATEKAIVFSQWTRMLDLMEIPLKDSCIQYRRLDGTMSVTAREKAIREFNTLPEVTVMIMSLKAASLGLNMVAACHVLLLDLWWNPTTEDQAIDRAHRIGQTRPVIVSRLTVKDTVEDRILALQEKKRVMVASAFGEDESGTRQTRLTVDELKYLFMA